MKSKISMVNILILSSAIYFCTGLFELSIANVFTNTNASIQEIVTNFPDQNNQVANTNTIKASELSDGAVKTSQSEQNKAYKQLNFGDNSDTVDNKLAEIIGGPKEEISIDHNSVSLSETFWRTLFDTYAEYEPYKYNPDASSQSDKLKSLMNYFAPMQITVHSYGNSAIVVQCYELCGAISQDGFCVGSLAAVEVSYRNFDLGKLVGNFMENYPNAHEENKSYKIESTIYPGIFLEFERTYFSDINSDKRAMLSIPIEKFAFTFTQPSKLSKEQFTVWENLMSQDGKTSQIDEYFASVKTLFLEETKRICS
jgi:hypothetical protein